MGCPACTGVLPFCDCDLDAEILDVGLVEIVSEQGRRVIGRWKP